MIAIYGSARVFVSAGYILAWKKIKKIKIFGKFYQILWVKITILIIVDSEKQFNKWHSRKKAKKC